MKKIKVTGYVIETPDGDTLDSTFDNDPTECIGRFMYKFNIFTKLNEDDPYLDYICWNDLYEDGYRVVPVTLTGVVSK
jgi:hypothetical protein